MSFSIPSLPEPNWKLSHKSHKNSIFSMGPTTGGAIFFSSEVGRGPGSYNMAWFEENMLKD